MYLPGVAVVLSGMSDMRQTEENVNTADLEYQLTDEELSKLEKKQQYAPQEDRSSLHRMPVLLR